MAAEAETAPEAAPATAPAAIDAGAAPAAPQAEAWEEPIPNYENLTVIGRGVSGVVLRGKSARFSRDCALKLIAPDLAANPGATERFFNEARLTARQRHPHLARGIDCGRSGRWFYYAMEYVRGESVRAKLDRLQSHKMKELETLRLMRQALDALQYVYGQSLLHYDLKPNNLLIRPDGELKIVDFGVAKDLAFPSFAAWTLANAAYVAPEQARGENPDVRSVLYTLGCTWYEMLCGAPPCLGPSPSATLMAQINDEPVPMAEREPKVSLATGQLLQWMLAKDRDKRPRNPQQLLSKMLTHPLVKLELEKEADARAAAAYAPAAPKGDDDDLLHDSVLEELGLEGDAPGE